MKTLSFVHVLLILSGVESKRAIKIYEKRLQEIYNGYLAKIESLNPLKVQPPPRCNAHSRAKILFEYLWNAKPRRFGDAFLLKDVIDAQLSPDVMVRVGNCVGLTSLYSVLGLKAGLRLSIMMNANHVNSRVHTESGPIDVDLTDPESFGVDLDQSFREYPLVMLAANVLNSRGLAHERLGDLEAALADYDRAIQINPEYANAFNNRGNMKLLQADYEGALADYGQALKLNPAFVEAYCNRGIANERLGELEWALHDYRAALALDPEYEDAARRLRHLETQLGVGCAE